MKKIQQFAQQISCTQISKSVYVVLLVVALCAGLTAFAVSTDVTACINNKTGAVKIINFLGGDCAKTETKMVWNIQGVAGDTGAQGPKGDKGDVGDTGPAGAQLHLYDANNQDLGIVMHGPDGENVTSFQVLLSTLGAFITISDTNYGPTDPHMNAGRTTGSFYTESDCTGQHFLPSAPPLAVLRDSQGRHFVVSNDLPITRSARSNFDGSGTCSNQTAYDYPHTSLLNEITLPFSEPILKPLHVALP